MRFIGIIPARYASSRFPGKPLAMINGKTMIQRVCEQSLKCYLLDEVIIATDDQRIFDHASGFARVVMTRPDHHSGTDRCLEALDIINNDNKYNDADCLINIQGDEPFIAPSQIELLVNGLKDVGKNIITLMKAISSEEEHSNPNVVKVVCTNKRKALYFSRAPIPFHRLPKRKSKSGKGFGFKHIGLYGFRMGALRQIASLNTSLLEETESLEQLRWLEHGFDIYLETTPHESIAIDTPEDLKKIKH